jgi:hypothetical protein
VTPSGPAVPENLLRIVVHLDAPLPHRWICGTWYCPAAMALRLMALFSTCRWWARRQVADAAAASGPHQDRRGRTWRWGRRCGRANVVLRIDDPQLGRVLEKRWQVQPPLRQAIMPQQWTCRRSNAAPDAVAGLLPNGAGCRRRAAAGAARAGRRRVAGTAAGRRRD